MRDEIPNGYCHCGCGRKTLPYTRNNRKLGHLKGQPARFIAGHKLKRARVDYQVEEGTGCWRWQRARAANGTGCIRPPEYGTTVAHKAYYIRTYGEIPEGRNVAQTCGNPLCVNPAHLALTATREEEFWLNVELFDESGCWEWRGTKNSAGYGMFSYKGLLQMAHLLAYAWTYGELPEDTYVRHRCNNRGCVNPDHLVL